MPLMHVMLTAGAYDTAGKDRLAAALTEAACAAESVPDRPQSRARALVLIQELAPGHAYSASQPADGRLRGVFVRWAVSTGVLDGARKARFAEALQAAAEAAGAPGDARPVVTSCIVEEVPEGQWAQVGRIARLPDVTAVAGFEHLVGAPGLG